MTNHVPPVPPGQSGALLHRGTPPPLLSGLLVALLPFVIVRAAAAFAPLQELLLAPAREPERARPVLLALLLFVASAVVLEVVFRSKIDDVDQGKRLHRGSAYAGTLFVALLGLVTTLPQGDGVLRRLVVDDRLQVLCFASVLALALVLHAALKRPSERDGGQLEPYQVVVERLRDTYELVLGIKRKEDWKLAATGQKEWVTLKEHSLWTNMFVFGGIDSGKTSAVAYPIVAQVMRKFPNDDDKRPSLVVLDLKGDNALRLWEFAKESGRSDEFFVVSPGNLLLDAAQKPIVDARGRPVIPPDRFLTWNPIGQVTVPADVRASMLLDGVSSASDGTKHSGSSEYFENVESEFLVATLQLLEGARPDRPPTLLDVYLFAYDPDLRADTIALGKEERSPAFLYFQNRFSKMKPDEQGHLISGLTAKLAKLTSASVRSTFCADPQDPFHQPFSSFLEMCVNRPSIVVFSVPEAIYSRELCRVLGIMFLRAFHNEMLQRSTSQFLASGGNGTRLVLNLVDECWAFMNKGVASFTAVSRQARVCSLYLTQSLDQIPESYRATVEGNFRTKLLMSVNDMLTLKRFEDLLGTFKECSKSTSQSSSLSAVKESVFIPGRSGKDRSVSESVSHQEQIRPRFSLHEIEHLPRGRAILHPYTEEGQKEAFAIETVPWFLPRFFLSHPLLHKQVGCKAKRSKAPHRYEERRCEQGKELFCSSCGEVVRGDDAVTQVHELLALYERARPRAVEGA